MSQMTFSDYEYSLRKRKTKREEYLEIMDEIIPWSPDDVMRSLKFIAKLVTKEQMGKAL